jgi:hypothetical protein
MPLDLAMESASSGLRCPRLMHRPASPAAPFAVLLPLPLPLPLPLL